MRVLFAASEVAPLSKTGGLADVAHALPKALCRLGHELRVVTPAYRGMLEQVTARRRVGALNLRGHSFAVWEGVLEPGGAPLWLVDCAELFVRDGALYTNATGREYLDNATRFGLFSELVAQLAAGQGGTDWRPDVVHLNDWHTGLAAAWIGQAAAAPPCVFTIHNLAYQGNYTTAQVASLGLPASWMSPAGLEFHGQASFIKAGLVYADALTTVSPTYAREILTPEFGDGMDGVLRGRAATAHRHPERHRHAPLGSATDPPSRCRRDFDAAIARQGGSSAPCRADWGCPSAPTSSCSPPSAASTCRRAIPFSIRPPRSIADCRCSSSLLGSGDAGAREPHARNRRGCVPASVAVTSASTRPSRT